MSPESLSFKPLTLERWDDFEVLFGERGAYGGCWCMWWRSSRREFEHRGNHGNKAAMRVMVKEGVIPGILAYEGSRPVGWCSIAPRSQYASLERSPVLKRIDDEPVWSIVCFYVGKSYREKGLMGALIDAAVDHATDEGARIVEAYPTTTPVRQLPPVSSFMGLPDVFIRHGFRVVSKPSKSRWIMRRSLRD